MMKKLLSIFLVLVLSISGITASVFADQEARPINPLMFKDIDIDGTDMSDIKLLYVERGESLNIRVEVESYSNVEDVRVKAYIAGYEYDEIEDITSIFDMEKGVRMVKNLRLSIPEDMDVNEDYEIRVKLYNQEYEVQASPIPTLRVKAQRHLLSIQDVIFTPGLNLNVNQPLFVSVRVENLGDKDQDDVKVEVSIPQLGKSGSTYIDELVAIETSDDDVDSDSSDTIYVDTKGAVAGTYDLLVKVTYNRGHDVLTQNYQLVINGASAGSQEVLVSATETSKSVEAGEGIAYKIDIANLGTSLRSFTAEVNGLDQLANYRIDPTPVIVQAGSNGEMFVYVSPNEGVTGQKTFTVTVKEGNNVVKQVNLQLNVTESKSEWGNVLNGLQIGFVVLLIILVILGIVLAVTRMNKKDDDDEPLGETYY